MKDYFMIRGDKTNEVPICQMFSLQKIPSKVSEVRTGNFIAPIVFNLPLESNIDTAIERTIAANKTMGITDAVGMESLLQKAVELPFGLATLAFKYLSLKHALTFSSVPGPTEGWKLKLPSGKIAQAENFFGFIPACYDFHSGLVVSSCAGALKMCFVTDTAYFDDPE